MSATRRFAVFFILCTMLLAGAASAAPFAERIEFKQPDGTIVTLWGEGDEFYAVFETLDGYTVVHDPRVKGYCYARVDKGGEALVSTGVLVGKGTKPPMGVVPHARISEKARGRIARERFQRWDLGMEVTRRWKEQKETIRKLEAEAAAKGDAVIMAPPGFTTTGTKVGLTLLVDFSDDVATIPQSEIDSYCNGDAYTGYGNNGSVKKYFQDNSGGLLTYSNVVTIYVRVPQPKTYYNDTTKDCGAQGNILIRDAIAAMKALPNYTSEILPTFANLTVDGSSQVIACNVFYAGGNGGVWSYGLWPHSWALYNVGAQALGNGKSVFRYQITNIGTSLSLGTFCHENGHMLCGYPDIYDYGYDSVGGAGKFCLMNSGGSGGNPVQICAYLKRASGWATVTELNSASQLTATLSSSGANFNRFYRYAKPGVATEYYLLENRQKTGRDANIPGGGIAAWHIDELGNHDNQSLTPNTTHANYEVTLVQADNLWHFQNNVNSGDANDLYYSGNTASGYANRLSDSTAPHAHWWDGSNSGLNVRDFSTKATDMTFVVEPASALGVSPATGATFAGPVGGGFAPASAVYVVTNSRSSSITWAVTRTQTWSSTSTPGGTLAARASTTVTVTVDSAANSLGQGTYDDTLRFTNSADTAVETRQITLRVGQMDYFTELFDTTANDLDSLTFTFTPTGSGSLYSATRQAASSFPADPAGGTALSLGDDGTALCTLSGAQVVLYGTSYGSFYVGGNGFVTFGAGDGEYTESLVNHFDLPRISALFDDLNSGSGGSVSWKQLADRAAVTFQAVPEYGVANANSFQIEMFFNGVIRITYLAIAATDGLAGLSRGTGVPADFVESDFTAYPLPSQQPPSFSTDPVVESDATPGASYGATLADDASDPDAGDTLAFSKVSGPSWLSVAAGGGLTGTPSTNDLGLNSFTIRVTDSTALSDTATLQIYVVSDPTLAAWYKMDEGSGTSVVDASGHGRDGAATGVSWTSGVRGLCLSFNGPDEVSVPASACSGVSGEVSVALWVNGDAAIQPQADSVLYAADAAGNRVLNIHLPWSDSNVYWDAGNSGSSTYDRINKAASAAQFEGVWNHWVFTKNAGTGVMEIYVNGVLWHSGTGKTRTMGGITAAKIGAFVSGGYNYDGLIDDVRVYTRALSSGEVAALYQSTANAAPVANADAAATAEDTPASIAVLANDTDADGDTLSVQSVTPGAHGSTAIAGASVIYTPAANWSGIDSFAYTASDGHGGTASATATVTVTPVNDEPTSAADAASTPEDTATTISVLANDTDIDGDALSIQSVTPGAHGATAISGPDVTYTPAANWSGTDTFVYTAGDGHGGTAGATVTVTVTPVNDEPVAAPDVATTAEGTAVDIAVLANDTDADGDTLSIQSVTPGAHGSTAIAGATVTYTPADGWSGTDTFAYTASDGVGGTASATVAVTVTPANHAPTAVADAATTDEDTAISIAVLANDTDADGDTLSIQSVTPGAHGSTVIAGASVVYTPAANWSGTDTFTYTASDGRGGTASATVTATVSPANDAPYFLGDPIAGIDGTVGQAYSGTLAGTAADVDAGDALSYSKVSGPAWLSVAASGALTGTPGAGDVGLNSFVIRVSDPSDSSDTATLNVTVAGTPVVTLTSPTNSTVISTAPATIGLAATVDPQGMTIASVQFMNGTNVVASDTTAPYAYTWTNVAAGTYGLKARAIYSGTSADSATSTVTVIGVPSPWLVRDIGTNGLAGSAGAAGSTYTVKGAGTLSGTSDRLLFVYQALSGDGEIRARIPAWQNTGTGARIGVMIRDTLNANARYSFIGIDGSGAFYQQRRTSTGGKTTTTTSASGTAPNIWVRVTRTGSTLACFKSANGTSWTQVDSRKITMASSCYLGLAVASGSSTNLNTSTFDSITAVP